MKKELEKLLTEKYGRLSFRDRVMLNTAITEATKELQDKVEMLDFFYEGNGFKRRGLNNSIQIADYIKQLEQDKADLLLIRNNKANAMCEDKEKLDEAKEIIKALLRVTYGEGWNYSLDVKIRAEQFLNKGE